MVLEGQELGTTKLTKETISNEFQNLLCILLGALSLRFVRNVMGFVKQWGSGFKNLVIQCA